MFVAINMQVIQIQNCIVHAFLVAFIEISMKPLRIRILYRIGCIIVVLAFSELKNLMHLTHLY